MATVVVLGVAAPAESEAAIAQQCPADYPNCKNVKQVDGGWWHNCAIMEDRGRVRCWGENRFSQVGNGDLTGAPVDRPATAVQTADRFGGPTGKALEGATDISAGGYCAPTGLPRQGDCVDYGHYRAHSCAVADGAVHCWGSNEDWQVGVSVPRGRTNYHWATLVPFPDEAERIFMVSAGGYHTCAIDVSNKLWCWGRNNRGQLGLGHNDPQRVAGPELVQGGVVDVAAGANHTCILQQNFTVRCFGAGDKGQLGDGGFNDSWLPVPIRVPSGCNLFPWGVAAGAQMSGLHSAYYDCEPDSLVQTWGWNDRWQLGDGGPNVDSPVPLFNIVTGRPATDLAMGERHSCLLHVTGDIRCWGWGIMGDGLFRNYSVPTLINTVSNAEAVTVGSDTSCVIQETDNGVVYRTLKCWGRNRFGQVGDASLGPLNDRQTPVTVRF